MCFSLDSQIRPDLQALEECVHGSSQEGRVGLDFSQGTGKRQFSSVFRIFSGAPFNLIAIFIPAAKMLFVQRDCFAVWIGGNVN